MRRLQWLSLGFGVNFIAILFVYTSLPARVAIHIGVSGQVNGWGPRWSVLAFALIPLVMLLALWVPKWRNSVEAYGATSIMQSIVLFFLALSWFPVWIAQHAAADRTVMAIVMALLGSLFAIIGRDMPGLKRNPWIGIRTPWTLLSDHVWERTHRTGGRVFIWTGLAMALSGIGSLITRATLVAIIVYICVLIGSLIWTVVLSYIYYLKAK
jgi:uncharacterized membrane protein